jgi:ATP-binding cassette subfamily B protein
VLRQLNERQEWKFFRVLPQASRRLALLWWAVIILRGVLPSALAITTGYLVAAVNNGDNLAAPLTALGVVFVILQVLTPLQTAVSANLGNRTAATLYDRLTEACVTPPGMGHLEDPRLAEDLTLARDFDLGMTGPPLFISMDFIATGLVQLLTGFVATVLLFGYTWWAPIVLGGAWIATHYLLRESSIWRDRQTDEVRSAQRDADYAYRIAVDPPAAKELRLFGLSDWMLDRFINRRSRLHQLQYQATRLREQPVIWSLLLVVAANGLVFWALADSAADGDLGLGSVVTYAQLAVSASLIAFGGLNWALDGAAAPVAAALRLREPM